ncbi:MAG: carboxypeptidase-like regulatory domain-containing protein [Bacilli bacterium]
MKKYLRQCALLLTSLSLLSGCGVELIAPTLDDYIYNYEEVFQDSYDPDMKIDGVLDEARWSNTNYLHFSEYDCDLAVTSFFTVYGIYIGGKAIDREMTYYGRFDMKNNSGFDIHLARKEQTLMQRSEVMRLQVDAQDRKSYYQDRFAGATKVEGVLNSGTECTMTFEMFVSWKEFGVEVLNQHHIPPLVRMMPTYRYVSRKSDSFVERHDITPTFGENTYVSGFYSFGPDGYLNPEIADCPLGNAKNGVSKSDGWDISHYDDEHPYIDSTYRNAQSIYFKDVYATNFIVETDASLIAPIGRANNPKFGLIAHGDGFMYFKAMYVRAYVDNEFYYRNNILRCAAMTYYPKRQFNEFDYIYLDRNSDLITSGVNSLHLKLIKSGKALMFFVGDTLIYSEKEDWFDNKMAPGLFAMDARVRFTNYSARSLTDSELNAYLEAEGVSRVTLPETFANGIITTKQQAVSFGEKLHLEIKPTNGYMLTNLTLNGIDYYQDYLDNVAQGSLTLDNLPEVGEIKVEARFSKVTRTVKAIYGNVTTNTGKNVPYANILVTSKYNFLFFKDTTSSNGSYLFNYLPIDGELIYDDGLHQYYSDGIYNFVITADGYRNVSFTYYVGHDGFRRDDINGELLEPNTVINMMERVVGGSVGSTNFSYVSNLTGWDLTDEDKEPSVVVATRGSSNNPLYFSNVVSRHAVIEMVVQDCTPIGDGYDVQPSVGISMQTGGFRMAVMIDGTNVRILPEFEWYNDAKHLISSKGLFRTNDKNKIGFKLIQSGSLIALLISPNNDKNYTLVYSSTWEELSNLDIAYGLYSRSSGLVKNVFSDFSINVDAEYVNSQIDQYLKAEMIINEPANGKLLVTDLKTGEVIRNGDNVVQGTSLSVTATADNNYYVYGILNGQSYAPLIYTKNGSMARAVITFNAGSSISASFAPLSTMGEDIEVTMISQSLPSYLSSSGTTIAETVSGLEYATMANIGADSLERNIHIGMKPSEVDFSTFVALEYEIIEGNSGEKISPYLVDGHGGVFKIGGKRNEYQATRRAGSVTEIRQASNWQGFSISGGCHATYSVDLTSDYYYDPNISKYGPGASSTLDLTNIAYVGLQTYAYKSNHWNFTLISIHGITALGDKVLVFDGANSMTKTVNGHLSELALPHEAMLFYEAGSGAVNYQTLTAITDVTKDILNPDDTYWQIHKGTTGDGYSWNNLIFDTTETNINLSFHDALVFEIDTTLGEWGTSTGLELDIELRYDDYAASGAKTFSRSASYYFIDEATSTVTKLPSRHIPVNAKGTIVALFEDMTINSNFMEHRYNAMTQARIIINTEGVDQRIFKLDNLRFVANGKAMVS